LKKCVNLIFKEKYFSSMHKGVQSRDPGFSR